MADARPTIFVVDDDASVRDAISNLLESVGVRAKVFASTEAFWKAPRPDAPSCIVLDVRLPGASGLEFQEMLIKNGVSIPIIFITAHGDVPMTSRAMKAGAIEFLMKPFQKEELLAAVRHGLERDRVRREVEAEISALESRVAQLTQREREVMDLVVTGLINKEIGAQLGLSEITVKIHRSRMMQKMEASSLAELVRMADKLKPRSQRTRS
jgi:FixJ family two-component response regulator